MNNKKAVSPLQRLFVEVKFHCRQRVKQVFHKLMPASRKPKPSPMTQLELFDWNKPDEPKQE